MEIIKHGSKVSIAKYIRECKACGCTFQYTKDELSNTFYDQREGCEYWYIHCPECNDATGFEKPTPIN